MARLTDAEIAAAESVNIVDYAKQLGYEATRSGQDFRIAGQGGLFIHQDGRQWNSFSENIGGGPIQFVQHMEGLSWLDAAHKLLDMSQTPVYSDTVHSTQTPPKPKTFVLPPKADNYSRLYAYLLKTRGLESEIVNHLVRQKMLYEDKRHNCVFVGKDKDGTPKYAALRGTYTGAKPFRGEVSGSDKGISFCMRGFNSRVFVLESPIDAASHASLWQLHGGDWRRDTRLSLGGLADKALDRFLTENPEITHITFALDNDSVASENHGQLAAQAFMKKYAALGYTVQNQMPKGKDFNEDLLVCRENQRQTEQPDCEQEAEEMEM